MNAIAKPIEPTISPDMRARWHDYITGRLMLAAGRLNIVPYDETDFSKLPADVHKLATLLRDDMRTRACIREIKAGSAHPRIGQIVEAELWNALKPFGRRGPFYVEHLVGDAETQREARIRFSVD